MRRLAGLVVTLCLLVAACSGTPSEERVRSQVVASLTGHGADELFDVEGFKVVGGHQQDDGTYVAQVHYDLVLKKGVNKLPKELEADPKLIRTVLKLGRALARAVINGTPIHAGTHVPVDDEVTLMKGADGWVLQ